MKVTTKDIYGRFVEHRVGYDRDTVLAVDHLVKITKRLIYRAACKCYLKDYLAEKGVDYDIMNARISYGSGNLPEEDIELQLRNVPIRLFKEVVEPGLVSLANKIGAILHHSHGAETDPYTTVNYIIKLSDGHIENLGDAAFNSFTHRAKGEITLLIKEDDDE